MNEKIRNKIIDAVEGDFETTIAMLQRLIRTPSVNPWFNDSDDLSGEQAVQDVFKDIFINLGADMIDFWEPNAHDLAHRANGPGYYPGRDFTGRPNLVAKFSSNTSTKPGVMIQGHCDVVSVGSLWTKDPFGGERVDGKIFGRGTIDMKGGMAAAIAGFAAIKKVGLELKGDVFFASVVDEEAGGMGTLALVDRGYIARGGTIIPEATNLNIAPLCRGILWGEIILHGRAGHIELKTKSWQEGGAVDAIEYGYKLLGAIRTLNKKWETSPVKNHKYLPIPCQVRVAQIAGGEFPTTYASACKITFNVQYLPIQKDSNGLGSNVKAELENFFTSFLQDDEWFNAHPPTINWLVDADCGETNDSESIVQETLAMAQSLGLESTLEGCMSHTDMGLMIDFGSPTITFGPGHMGVAHQADEHILEKDLLNATKIFALTIATLCC